MKYDDLEQNECVSVILHRGCVLCWFPVPNWFSLVPGTSNPLVPGSPPLRENQGTG